MLDKDLAVALAGRYTIERELGAGGMARVYLAHDLKHDREVAIKVLRPDLAAILGAERFLQEIRITARLAHPHILPLLDSGEADGGLYYVMPRVVGESLRDRLKREPILPMETALQLAGEVADALAYAHAQGVLHRDIKPENILLQGGHAVVADFGIARAVSEAGGEHLTQSGVSIGTPAYMSPEQAVGAHGVDVRSDQYSLACVLYEMLVGEAPATGPNPQSIIARKLTETPRPVRVSRNAVPTHVDAAIARALARNAADRFSTIEAFRSALATPAPEPSPLSTQRRVLIATTAVGLLVTALFAARLLSHEAPASVRPRIAVLPLDHVGPAENQYFTDGITEEITSRLSGISGLAVVSRTSAKRFKGRALSVPQVGDSLGADFILEGVVRGATSTGRNEQARVSLRLIRVRNDEPVWSRELDVPVDATDLFRVQGDIATQVATALNVTLLEPERRTVARVSTRDTAAHRLYQMGRFQWEKRDGASLLRAAEYFRQAIAHDSSYANAYAGLADALNIHHELFAPEVREEGRAAIAAARRAVALDSTLAEAYAGLGFTLFLSEWDWAGADHAFRRSIALDPNCAPSHYWYAQLVSSKNIDSALAIARRAAELDRLSGIAHLVLGTTLLNLRRTDEAIMELQLAADLQPTSYIAWQFLTLAHVRAGHAEQSRSAATQFLLTLVPGRLADSVMVTDVIAIFSRRAEPALASRLVRHIGADANNAAAALWFTTGGLADSAFARANVALERRSAFLPVAQFWMQMAFAGDPRLDELRRRMAAKVGAP